MLKKSYFEQIGGHPELKIYKGNEYFTSNGTLFEMEIREFISYAINGALRTLRKMTDY